MSRAFSLIGRNSAGRKDKRKEVFSTIERNRVWGAHISGAGSSLDATATTRRIVETVVKQLEVASMVDVACGDFVWMPLVLERLSDNFQYTGCDIVPALVEKHSAAYPQFRFQTLDFVLGEIPKADLIFCRDALQHLPVRDIITALDNFSNSGAKYLMASTHLRRTGLKNAQKCKVGKCRDRNLILPPFNLPDPIVIYGEQDSTHKFLGVWELPFDS